MTAKPAERCATASRDGLAPRADGPSPSRSPPSPPPTGPSAAEDAPEALRFRAWRLGSRRLLALRVFTPLVLALALAACVTSEPSRDASVAAEFQRSRLGVTLWEAGRHLDEGRAADARRTLSALDTALTADGRVQLLLARLALAEGRPATAAAHLQSAAEALPDRPEVDVLAAQLAESHGDWELAERAYAAASAKAPDDAAAVLGRSRALLAQGRAADALALLESEIASRPLSGELLRAAGLASLAAGRPGDAATALREALDLLADGPRTLEPLVLALAACERQAEIVALAESFDLLALPAAGLAAACHAALLEGRAELAVATAQARVQQRPSDAGAWVDLARSHFVAGRYRSAEEALLQSGALLPWDAAAWTLLGHVRGRLLRVDEAMECYRQAVLAGADGTQLAPVMLALVEARERHAAARELLASTPVGGSPTAGALPAPSSVAHDGGSPAPGVGSAASSGASAATSAGAAGAFRLARLPALDLGPCALPPLPAPVPASEPAAIVAELLERRR